MRRRFVSKKRHKNNFFKLIKYSFFLVVIYFVYKVTVGTLLTIKLASSNEEFLKYLLSDSNHHLVSKENNKDIISKTIKFFSGIVINDPVTIVTNSFNFKPSSVEETDDTYDNINELSNLTSHITDPNSSVIDNPRVYIYNSHQLENYSTENLEIYNVTPNVMMASYLLKDKLNKLGIKTIAEEADITEFMRQNSWEHADSYKASRFYILDALNDNPDLDLIIDLHRDALSHDSSTTTINGKSYAKVLFVVGLEHDNYQANLDLANTINNLIKQKYPNLTRGIIKKQGQNVDGIYNQDISPKMILLELGGNESTIEEVMNTIDIIAEIIKEYLGE